MKILTTLILWLSTLGLLASGTNTVTVNFHTYTNISEVRLSNSGRVIILFDGGGVTLDAGKLPPGFLESWGITSQGLQATHATLAKQNEKQAEEAIRVGYFRKVSGIIYDIRRPESDWVFFPKVKVIQVLDKGVIVDVTPDDNQATAVHVRHLPDTLGDTDTISFFAKLCGSYSYINKLNDDRTIRDYDAGHICSREEIPATVLSGSKPFDVAEPTGTPTNDVVAGLPNGDDLRANGTGFFITPDGYLVSNYHVVKGAQSVKVKTKEGIYPATIIYTDAQEDLAVLKVAGTFKPLRIKSKEASLGESVFTIGFPNIVLQGTEPKYTDGRISSLAGIKDDPKEYQISVPVQPGNSGGPVADTQGEVIGIVVARLDDMAALQTSGTLPQNVNYAIKSSILNKLLGEHPEIKVNQAPASNADNAVQSVKEAVAMVLVY